MHLGGSACRATAAQIPSVAKSSEISNDIVGGGSPVDIDPLWVVRHMTTQAASESFAWW